jgi:transcriptional regulator with XRE-family HTH domain
MNPDEIGRRIAAARLLRNVSQKEMDELGAADGLGRQELSRVERGTLPLTRVRIDTLVRNLGVPERWFIEDDTDIVVGLRGDGTSVTGAQLRALTGLVEDAVEKGLLTSFEEARVKIEPSSEEEVDEGVTPSIADRARQAAQRLDGTRPESPGRARAAGGEGEGPS